MDVLYYESYLEYPPFSCIPVPPFPMRHSPRRRIGRLASCLLTALRFVLRLPVSEEGAENSPSGEYPFSTSPWRMRCFHPPMAALFAWVQFRTLWLSAQNIFPRRAYFAEFSAKKMSSLTWLPPFEFASKSKISIDILTPLNSSSVSIGV